MTTVPYSPIPSLHGTQVIITGGASGMGAALVRAFARAGARVVSMDRAIAAGAEIVADANEQAAIPANFVGCDVADEASVTRAFSEAVVALEGLDTVIHAAGIAPGCPAENISVSEWDNVFAANTRGTFLVNKAAFAHLRETGGRILNFASGAGIKGQPNKAHYSASKGAVVAWTRTVAHEWGRYGITVNAIAPAISTPMYAKTRSKMSPQALAIHDAKMAADMPIDGALGDCERDLVPVLAFLSTDGARFITGQVIPIDGGLLMVR
ncbi:MAG: SDR family oxidoreductase [Novosphingobium sp.]|nr:SDR family oxidoreductase [Novosphingobium sp.]